VKYQRRTLVVAVALYPADEDDVVSGIVPLLAPAFEQGDYTLQNRRPAQALDHFQPGELVPGRLAEPVGGSSETEQNEFAVTPAIRPSGARAVTIVIPVANDPSARRSSRVSVTRTSDGSGLTPSGPSGLAGFTRAGPQLPCGVESMLQV
jgi:hypothetical protein